MEIVLDFCVQPHIICVINLLHLNSLLKKRAVGILPHFQIDKVTSKQRWAFLRKCGTVSQEQKQVTVENKGTQI